MAGLSFTIRAAAVGVACHAVALKGGLRHCVHQSVASVWACESDGAAVLWRCFGGAPVEGIDALLRVGLVADT